MTKRAFDKIAAGLRDAAAINRGEVDPSTYRVHVPEAVDVKAIRKGLGLSQEAFASEFGLAPSSVRDWEQNRRAPEAPTRILLKVIETEPDAVRRALGSTRPGIAATGSFQVRGESSGRFKETVDVGSHKGLARDAVSGRFGSTSGQASRARKAPPKSA